MSEHQRCLRDVRQSREIFSNIVLALSNAWQTKYDSYSRCEFKLTFRSEIRPEMTCVVYILLINHINYI